MIEHKVKIIFPEKFNDILSNLPIQEDDGDWWITDGEDNPDDRPHIEYSSGRLKSKYKYIFYFHLHRTLHEWLVERNISYIIGSSDNYGRTLTEEGWNISFKNESDAILFKLTWF